MPTHLPQSTPPQTASQNTPTHLAQIRGKLARHTPRRLADSCDLHHAAVALILREKAAGREDAILIIRRAEHPRDPWSGHLGFPGGRLEPHDATPERAAVRETQEELGLSLDACARFMGSLSEIRARSLSRSLPLSIFPFVYELVEPAALKRNEEIVETHWIPLGFFLDAANRSTMPHPREPEHIMPCYPIGDRAIWGLSLAMLDELLRDVLGA